MPSIESDRDSVVDAHVPAEKWHVPFEQMIVEGDGDSDLPVFARSIDSSAVRFDSVQLGRRASPM